MPLTPDMRRSIDQIRDYLFGGGYPDPVSNAEQLSYLFFFYLVEGIYTDNIGKARVLGRPYTPLFAGHCTLKNPLNAPAAAIIQESDVEDASLIVMTTHGRTGLQQALYGSVALNVLRHGQRPVCLIRPSMLQGA